MPRTEHQPHIVFIVLDTHRVDRLGCYGYKRGTSPNLDAFARTATVFENAAAPAQWTIPSHASMFTGQPPSAHLTLQADDALDSRFETLAERLAGWGYRTLGFCNNPLVGVVSNGLKRGFETFYNYGGAIPYGPRVKRFLPAPLSQVWESTTRALRSVSYPIQDAFAHSTGLFQAALLPFVVPIWTRIAHSKGLTARSIRDVRHLVRKELGPNGRRPHCLFLNLMETHLPYRPPERFVAAFAPQVREDRAARDFVREHNRRAVDWITPLEHPLSELQRSALSDMYDAEVAYQDHLLGPLLETLDQPQHREGTMVVIVADHGEMLGEHQLMGHGFGVYQELVHVPLLVRFPEQSTASRVPGPVLATRVFHTILEAAGANGRGLHDDACTDIHRQSLRGDVQGWLHEQPVVSEAYAPEFALQVMARHKPGLLTSSEYRSTQRAVYEDGYKLIRVENVHDRLFALRSDPFELWGSSVAAQSERMERLAAQLEAFLDRARQCRPDDPSRTQADLDDQIVRQRLRDLGYLE